MRTIVQDKYYLRDLHREIDLYDRKLIHILNHEVFATEDLRLTAARKLTTKRESLAETARTLAAAGIEYDDKELPRSFRPKGGIATREEAAPATKRSQGNAVEVPDKVAEITSLAERKSLSSKGRVLSEQESALASALGSWEADLAAYKKRRQKTAAAV